MVPSASFSVQCVSFGAWLGDPNGSVRLVPEWVSNCCGLPPSLGMFVRNSVVPLVFESTRTGHSLVATY